MGLTRRFTRAALAAALSLPTKPRWRRCFKKANPSRRNLRVGLGFFSRLASPPFQQAAIATQSKSVRAALAAALFAFLAAGCVAARPTPAPLAEAPLAQRALLDGQGEPVTAQRLAEMAANADYILIGEGHANACDHLAQADVINALAKSGVLPAIGFEMLPAKAQPLLAAVNDQDVPLDALPERLNWKDNWGYDFSMYAPIFQAARAYNLPAYALNADKTLVKKVSRQGLDSLAPAERATLPGEIIPPPPGQEQFLNDQFEQHKTMRSEKSTGGAEPAMPAFSDERMQTFFTIQALWDTQMAQRALLARALSGRPVAVIAGSGHVENGWGLSHRLKRLDPGARVLLIMPWRGGETPAPGEADLFYYCPLAVKSRLGFTLEIDEPGQNGAATILVVAVEPGSKAEKAGLLPGDALIKAGDAPVSSPFDLHKAAISAGKEKKPLILDVRRAEEIIPVSIELSKSPPKAD
jgi:uncharacterized iron-regulated protein